MSSRIRFDQKHQWHRQQFGRKVAKSKRYRPPVKRVVG